MLTDKQQRQWLLKLADRPQGVVCDAYCDAGRALLTMHFEGLVTRRAWAKGLIVSRTTEAGRAALAAARAGRDE